MLRISELCVGYGPVMAVHDASCSVDSGEIVGLIGANGAGKSTLLRAIAGTVGVVAGRILLDDEEITHLRVHHRSAKGLCLLPEAGGIFRQLTVDENLDIASLLVHDRRERARRRTMLFEYFPVLSQRRKQPAGTLSGGERQMLALARSLIMQPKLLMMDEPSLGLAPQVVDLVAELIRRFNRELGMTVLLSEQNSVMALSVADRAYIMETGRITLDGLARDLSRDPAIRAAYLGMSASL